MSTQYSRRRPVALVGVLCFLALTGCVTTAEQGRRMRRDIDELEVRVREQKDVLDEGVQRIDEKLAEVTRSMESLGLSARRNDADFGATVDRLIAEMQSVRGSVEELRYQVDQLRKDLDAQKEETDRRFAALGGADKLKAYEAKKKAEELARPSEPKAFLALARKEHTAGDPAVARRLLDEFLDRWPKDPGAAEAQLLLAESYFADKAWRPAILEYNKFREKWPDHPKMPEALLNIGESFVAIQLKPEAGKFFDALIKRFPRSQEARKARQRKKALGIR